MNKKTIAVKQDDKILITRGMADMPPSKLAKETITANRGLRGILSSIGRVYEVPFSDGRVTTAVMLTYERINSLGIDLNTVFEGSKGFNARTDVKNGILVNLDLYQQVALLRAIVESKPELGDILGLYNLKASRKVYEVLNRRTVHNEPGIWWMWTGEIFVPRQSESAYPEESIVTLNSLSVLKDNRFCYRYVDLDYWYDLNPDLLNHDGAVVLGAQN